MLWFDHAQRSTGRPKAPSHRPPPSKLDRNPSVASILPDPMMQVWGPDGLEAVANAGNGTLGLRFEKPVSREIDFWKSYRVRAESLDSHHIIPSQVHDPRLGPLNTYWSLRKLVHTECRTRGAVSVGGSCRGVQGGGRFFESRWVRAESLASHHIIPSQVHDPRLGTPCGPWPLRKLVRTGCRDSQPWIILTWAYMRITVPLIWLGAGHPTFRE